MEDNKVALKRKGIENNRIIATLNDIKSLFGIMIGTIVCGNSVGDQCIDTDHIGKKSTLHAMDFEKPQWYGSIEVCGLECVKADDEVDENTKVFVKQKGKEGLCGILLPLADIPIETIAELAVDLSETFGCGDAIEEVFSENIGEII
jgi:hypothetical protein